MTDDVFECDSLKVEREREGTALRYTWRGVCDRRDAPPGLSEFILNEESQAASKLRLDFTELNFVNSRMLVFLIRTIKSVSEASPSVHITYTSKVLFQSNLFAALEGALAHSQSLTFEDRNSVAPGAA